MEPKVDPSTVKPKSEEQSERPIRHLKSFFWMMIMTAAAFLLVGFGVSAAVVIPIIMILAVIQVVLQLFTFMHLDQKGSFFPILFMAGGIIVAITCILAMTLWV